MLIGFGDGHGSCSDEVPFVDLLFTVQGEMSPKGYGGLWDDVQRKLNFSVDDRSIGKLIGVVLSCREGY